MLEHLLQQVLAGLANGAIYALVALAVVMIYQAIDHFNFAQGEMAMFSTYIAWQLMAWGMPFWVVFFITLAVSFAIGAFLELVVFKPIHDAPVLSHIVVFIALLAIFNSLAGAIWDYTIKAFPTPFPTRPIFGSLIGNHALGMIVVSLILLLIIYLFFRYTSVGLAMRGAAQNPDSARLVGVRVRNMAGLGWGLAATVGAVAGIMVAHAVFLEPNMMLGILLYGFAGAIVGGVDNPGGAVLGGFIVGVLENLVAWFGNVIDFPIGEIKLTIALVFIVGVLMFRPAGLFGRRVVKRV